MDDGWMMDDGGSFWMFFDPYLIFFCVFAEVRAVEPRAAWCAVHGREVPRDLGQSQTALLRLRRLCLLEIHPLTQCRCGRELFVNQIHSQSFPLLNPQFSGEVRNLNNKQHVQECSEQVRIIQN